VKFNKTTTKATLAISATPMVRHSAKRNRKLLLLSEILLLKEHHNEQKEMPTLFVTEV